MKDLKENFDVERYLDDLRIPYYTEGKNVHEGWLNIQCIFCPDHSNHLGIKYTEDNHFHCWLCDEGNDILALIMALEHCGFQKAKRRLEEYQLRIRHSRQKEERPSVPKTILPPLSFPINPAQIPEPVLYFLQQRRFPEEICIKYKLGFVEHGDWALRIIVPFYYRGELVCYQGIDSTLKAEVRYQDCPKDKAVIPVDQMLYGIDDVGDQIIIVEGILDKWRIGDDAVALCTKHATPAQRNLILPHAGKRIKLVLDRDATSRDRARLRSWLRDLPDPKQIIELEPSDPKDPDEMTSEMIAELISL